MPEGLAAWPVLCACAVCAVLCVLCVCARVCRSPAQGWCARVVVAGERRVLQAMLAHAQEEEARSRAAASAGGGGARADEL
jgi:hypothetical protein